MDILILLLVNYCFPLQMNQVTHWLDGSNIYGSKEDQSDRLRLRRGGLMKTSSNNLLPVDQVGGRDYHAGNTTLGFITK